MIGDRPPGNTGRPRRPLTPRPSIDPRQWLLTHISCRPTHLYGVTRAGNLDVTIVCDDAGAAERLADRLNRAAGL